MAGFRITGNRSSLPLMSEAMLDAYVDGELDEFQRSAVEAHIDRHPAAMAYVAQERELRRNLHRMFDPRAQEPLPAGLAHRADMLEAALTRPPAAQAAAVRRRPGWMTAMAAGILFAFLAGGFLSYFGFSKELENTSLLPLLQGGSAEPEGDTTWGDILPADSIAVGTPSDIPANSIEGEAPDFSAKGFSLISVRTRSADLVQLVYEDAQGARVELYYGPSGDGDGNHVIVLDDGPVTTLAWSTLGRSFTLVGDVDRETLLDLGRVVNGHWSSPAESGEPTVQEQEGEQPKGEEAPSESDGTAT